MILPYFTVFWILGADFVRLPHSKWWTRLSIAVTRLVVTAVSSILFICTFDTLDASVLVLDMTAAGIAFFRSVLRLQRPWKGMSIQTFDDAWRKQMIYSHILTHDSMDSSNALIMCNSFGELDVPMFPRLQLLKTYLGTIPHQLQLNTQLAGCCWMQLAYFKD